MKAFDRRGQILETIHQPFKSKMEHWRVQNVEVTMADDFDHASRAITVSHLRSAITYEDPDSHQEFLDDSRKFLELLHETFPTDLGNIARMGFRSLSVLKWDDRCKSYEDCNSLIRDKFFNPTLPLSLQFDDCGAILMNDSTRVYIGPFKKGEDWEKKSFARPVETDQEFGIGLDVDCYATKLKCDSVIELKKACRTLQDLSLAVESEIVEGLLQ